MKQKTTKLTEAIIKGEDIRKTLSRRINESDSSFQDMAQKVAQAKKDFANNELLKSFNYVEARAHYEGDIKDLDSIDFDEYLQTDKIEGEVDEQKGNEIVFGISSVELDKPIWKYDLSYNPDEDSVSVWAGISDDYYSLPAEVVKTELSKIFNSIKISGKFVIDDVESTDLVGSADDTAASICYELGELIGVDFSPNEEYDSASDTVYLDEI